MRTLATIFFCLAVCDGLHADLYTVRPLDVPFGVFVIGLSDSGQVTGYAFNGTIDQAFIGAGLLTTNLPKRELDP